MFGFHAFTGADTCGKVANATKERCFKLFMSFDDSIRDALETLGDGEYIPGEHTIDQIQRMVCIIYKQKKFSNVGNLRWFLYVNHQSQEKNLPPSMGALLPHIYRAHCYNDLEASLRMPQKSSLKSLFVWDMTENRCLPVKNLNLPAPQDIIDFVKCGCKKGWKCCCSFRMQHSLYQLKRMKHYENLIYLFLQTLVFV